ncbi:hypothetical protein [Neobacillus bataviensis]|uniref:hypothetical protein n=1 Tax=Neobacillus bataviensis TaxID=220685 RepID=UPI001CBD8EE2|nr:hypothetical protein [Neobacillus bataviensis]
MKKSFYYLLLLTLIATLISCLYNWLNESKQSEIIFHVLQTSVLILNGILCLSFNDKKANIGAVASFAVAIFTVYVGYTNIFKSINHQKYLDDLIIRTGALVEDQKLPVRQLFYRTKGIQLFLIGHETVTIKCQYTNRTEVVYCLLS